jgi:hypothetical protein
MKSSAVTLPRNFMNNAAKTSTIDELKPMITDFLPALKGRGFPSRGLIVPTIGSGLHPSFGGQSSGSEKRFHLKGNFHPNYV